MKIEEILKETFRCPHCGGSGWTSEHSPNCAGECKENECPVPVECDCAKYFAEFSDSLLSAILSALPKERKSVDGWSNNSIREYNQALSDVRTKLKEMFE